jgi:tRNA threonylcarbamoyladenosine biosynthesis protein TsaB
MKLLLIHTAGNEGVAALSDEAEVIAQEALPGRGTSETLMPAIRRILAETGWKLAELDALGVVNGPGSFTGVRVGLSAAKGLCEAAGLGMIAVSRLALLATVSEREQAVAVLDAGRGEFYCGVYRNGEAVCEQLLREGETRARLAEGEPLTCDASVAERLGIRLVPEPGAEAMLAMVTRRIGAGEWSDVAAVDANYLRRTDAELLKNKAG